MTVAIRPDDGTTYHQQAPAGSSDTTIGKDAQVHPDGGIRPTWDASDNGNPGTAGDIPVMP